MRKGEPLVTHTHTHKLIAPKERLSGNEAFEAVDDWYEEMRMHVDLVMPGSQVITEWAEQETTSITQERLLARHDASMAVPFSLEMYVLPREKT